MKNGENFYSIPFYRFPPACVESVYYPCLSVAQAFFPCLLGIPQNRCRTPAVGESGAGAVGFDWAWLGLLAGKISHSGITPRFSHHLSNPCGR